MKHRLMNLACWRYVWLAMICVHPSWGLAGEAKQLPPVPTPGMVTMVDLGADKCVPCKLMAPILAELQKEYAGRASILFIDVWKNHDQVERFGISAIPTQVFYDARGREVRRHVGFMDKKSIVAVLEKLGVK